MSYKINNYTYPKANYSNYAVTNTSNVSFKSSNLSTPPDTVELSTSNKKKGLSNGAKWGIGAIALAGIATLACVLSRGKVGKNEVKQLAEHIEFKPAKTVEEAKKFAQDNFNIKLDLDDNLFMANFVNESCVNVSNKMKGKAAFPKKITFEDYKGLNGAYDYFSNILSLNQRNLGNTQYNFCNVFNNTLKSKYNSNYAEYIKKIENSPRAKEIVLDMRSTMYHELGHCNHKATCKDFLKMDKLHGLVDDFINDKHITKEFLNDKDLQNIAGQVSDYAKSSPAEFVAETFAKKMMGEPISKEVEELYVKYCGPALS